MAVRVNCKEGRTMTPTLRKESDGAVRCSAWRDRFLLGVKHWVVCRCFHQSDRVCAIGTVDVALAASGNGLAILGVVDPIPVTTVVLLLPITRIRNFSHNYSSI